MMADTITALRQALGETRWCDIEATVTQLFQAGVGVSEASWPTTTPINEVLTWLDQTIAKMCTPYNISGFLLIAFCDDAQDSAIELTCTSHDLWPALREGLTPTLTRLAEEHTITLTIFSFGTALAAALQ